MNPHFGKWAKEEEDTGLVVPLRPVRPRWMEEKILYRTPGERPPLDRAQWLAWANGEKTTGPRWERIQDAEARASILARREKERQHREDERQRRVMVGHAAILKVSAQEVTEPAQAA